MTDCCEEEYHLGKFPVHIAILPEALNLPEGTVVRDAYIEHGVASQGVHAPLRLWLVVMHPSLKAYPAGYGIPCVDSKYEGDWPSPPITGEEFRKMRKAKAW